MIYNNSCSLPQTYPTELPVLLNSLSQISDNLKHCNNPVNFEITRFNRLVFIINYFSLNVSIHVTGVSCEHFCTIVNSELHVFLKKKPHTQGHNISLIV